jgi:hypothetical protein
VRGERMKKSRRRQLTHRWPRLRTIEFSRYVLRGFRPLRASAAALRGDERTIEGHAVTVSSADMSCGFIKEEARVAKLCGRFFRRRDIRRHSLFRVTHNFPRISRTSVCRRWWCIFQSCLA